MFERLKSWLGWNFLGNKGGHLYSGGQPDTDRPFVKNIKDDVDSSYETTTDRPTLVIESKDTYRNSEIGRAIIGTLEGGTMGSGLEFQSSVDPEKINLDNSPEENKKKILNISGKIEDYWNHFCEDCDWFGEDHFNDIQKTAFRTLLLDGDFFFMVHDNGQGLKIRIIEGQSVRTPVLKDLVNDIDDGVRLDENNKPISIFVFDKNGKYRELPIYDRNGNRIIFHVALRFRANQCRGIPVMSSVFRAINDLEEYSDAELQSAKLQAKHSVMISRKRGGKGMHTGALSRVVDQANQVHGGGENVFDDVIDLGVGNVFEKSEDVDVALLESKHPKKEHNDFVTNKLTFICAAFGLPVTVVRVSFNSNYSASRAELLAADRVYDLFRAFFIRKFNQKIYGIFLDDLVKQGKVRLRGYNDDTLKRNAWQNADWFGMSLHHIDPEKEIKARAIGVETGLVSAKSQWKAIHGKRARDVEREVYEEGKFRDIFFKKDVKKNESPSSEDKENIEEDQQKDGKE